MTPTKLSGAPRSRTRRKSARPREPAPSSRARNFSGRARVDGVLDAWGIGGMLILVTTPVSYRNRRLFDRRFRSAKKFSDPVTFLDDFSSRVVPRPRELTHAAPVAF